MESSLTLKVLSIMLGIFFFMCGFLKLSVFPSEELHRDIRRMFIRLARVWPLAISANTYRKIIGTTEMFGGMCLALIPGMHAFKLLVNYVLAFSTVVVLTNMYFSGEKFERTAQFIVFLFMTICRIIVHYQARRQQRIKQEAEKNVFKGILFGTRKRKVL